MNTSISPGANEHELQREGTADSEPCVNGVGDLPYRGGDRQPVDRGLDFLAAGHCGIMNEIRSLAAARPAAINRRGNSNLPIKPPETHIAK